jgi:4-hydroxymandelate oxidase
MPLLFSPTAFHRLAHPSGEAGTAGAAAAEGVVMVVSMAATQPIEEIAAAFATAAGQPAAGQPAPGQPAPGQPAAGQPAPGQPTAGQPTAGQPAAGGGALWFQLYPQPDAGFERHVVARAENAGCRALVVTADSPVFGRHERDLRNGFTDLPSGLACENMRDAEGRLRDIAMDPTLTWAVVDRLRALTDLPIVLKGVLHPADARIAAGKVDAILVSNHGGRQLDGAIAPLDALPAVVSAVDGRIPVLMDGGVRSGTDMLVALALGATAIGIGRPVIWALAAGGPPSVRALVSDLRRDLDHVLALAGAKRPAGLTPDLIA